MSKLQFSTRGERSGETEQTKQIFEEIMTAISKFYEIYCFRPFMPLEQIITNQVEDKQTKNPTINQNAELLIPVPVDMSTKHPHS